MTVVSDNNEMIYNGDGSATVFPYTFRIFEDSNIQVLFDNVVQSSGFTVSGAGSANGGDITFSTAPAAGVDIRIRRVLPITQESDYKNQGSFFASTHEDSFDRGTMIDQQLQTAINDINELAILISRSDTVDPSYYYNILQQALLLGSLKVPVQVVTSLPAEVPEDGTILIVYGEGDAAAINSDDVVNASTVTGATVSDALEAASDLSNYLAKDNTDAFTPTADYHPATKKYADDLDAANSVTDQGYADTNFLSKTNTTAFTPTADYHPATKLYADGLVGSAFPSVIAAYAQWATPASDATVTCLSMALGLKTNSSRTALVLPNREGNDSSGLGFGPSAFFGGIQMGGNGGTQTWFDGNLAAISYNSTLSRVELVVTTLQSGGSTTTITLNHADDNTWRDFLRFDAGGSNVHFVQFRSDGDSYQFRMGSSGISGNPHYMQLGFSVLVAG